MLSAFLVRYYVPAEARVRAAGDPVSARRTGTRCASCVPDTDWAVPQRGTAPALARAGRHTTRATCSRASGSSRSKPRSAPRIRSTLSAATSGLSVVPRSFICVDISHNQGRDTVGSLVWFEAGRPRKSEYRKFKIQGPGQQDDFAAIARGHHPVPHPAAGRGASASRPDRDRRRQGPAQRGARRGCEASGSAAIPMVEPRQAGGGGLPAGPAREPATVTPEPVAPSAAAGARRGAPIRPGVQPEAAHAAHHHLRAAQHPRRRPQPPPPCCSSASAVSPGVKSASVAELATVPGFSTRLAERILSHLNTAK